MKHVPLEGLVGARVLALCNLKPSKLKGVESRAMLLCAKTADEPCSKMELLVPPAGAAVGERVTFGGSDAPPLDMLPPKKKIWEKLQPRFRTDADGTPRFETLTFDTSAGTCTAPSIKNGAIG